MDRNGRIVQMNPVAETLTGWSNEEAFGLSIAEVYATRNAETREQVENPVARVYKAGNRIGRTDIILESRHGDTHLISDSVTPVLNVDNRITGIVLVFRDISEENRILEQLIHTQKMDAVGKLAGGIAHDFNNMLTGIWGCAEVLQERVTDPELRGYIDIIVDASERSAELTRKLLAFSRKSTLKHEPVDVGMAILQSVSILEHTIPKNVGIEVDLQSSINMTTGDPGELQNIFINLAINSADAMPSGGRIVFSMVDAILSPEECAGYTAQVLPGKYLIVSVSDTGTGIPAEHLDRILEPFFTTKGSGKGTGLGLAAVYNTMKLHGGGMRIETQTGTGTTVRLAFPAVSTPEIADKANNRNLEYGSGTILIIDDEEAVRMVAAEHLEGLGYRIMTAKTGKAGIRVLTENREIRLVLLDMILPDMNGRECFSRLREIRADIRIIAVSGFFRDVDIADLKQRNLSGIIVKPFSKVELSRIVAKALG